MKRADIEAGKVYAYYEGRDPHHYVSAWLMVDVGHLITRPGRSNQSDLMWVPASPIETGMKSGRATWSQPVGLLAVDLAFDDNDAEEYERKLARVRELASLKDALTRKGNQLIREGLGIKDGDEHLGSYRMLVNAVYLHGDYRTWRDLGRARDAETARMAAEHDRRAAENLARYRVLEARWKALGAKDKHYVGDYSEPTGVTFSFDDIEKILDLAETSYNLLES